MVVPVEESGLTTGKTRRMFRTLQSAMATRGYPPEVGHVVRLFLAGTANSLE
jgi:hypothetical protein